MRESQKHESLRLPLTTLFSVSSRKAPKLDQSRLVGMQFQTELHQPLLEITQEPLGVSSVLKAQHKVVGISDNYDIAVATFLRQASTHRSNT